LPAVSTFSEAGVPGFHLALWQGLVAPKGTPPDIVNRLAVESAKALAAPQIRERMASMGVEVIGSNPERLQRFLADEVLRWKGLANSLNVKLD
jgi:tripartite-type tricarboxylate transporter receptor subunit TctC